MTPSPESYHVLHLLSPADINRFWSKVNKESGDGPWGDCWIWTDVPAGNGYGYLGVGGRKGRKIQAYQISYEIAQVANLLVGGSSPPTYLNGRVSNPRPFPLLRYLSSYPEKN
jgi:hypothetical protein